MTTGEEGDHAVTGEEAVQGGQSVGHDGNSLASREPTERQMELGADENSWWLHLAWTGGRMKDGALWKLLWDFWLGSRFLFLPFQKMRWTSLLVWFGGR